MLEEGRVVEGRRKEGYRGRGVGGRVGESSWLAGEGAGKKRREILRAFDAAGRWEVPAVGVCVWW